MHASARRNRFCPAGYELIGFDNNVEYTPFTNPALTSFEQPLNEVGTAAVVELLGRLENGNGADAAAGKTVPNTLFEPRLIVRESFTPAASAAPGTV